MPRHFVFKTYAWSLGTTSFRMADFHRKVEEQLLLLEDFWNDKRKNKDWRGNNKLQVEYYNYLYENKFVTGNISDLKKKAKTARQKTSGLVDIGLIDDNRRITPVGKKLLEIMKDGNFSSDNVFQIPKDSFIYLKQIIKTSCVVEVGCVRPFLMIGKLLQACNDYLTDDEFTFLLPLCVDSETTNNIIHNIALYRQGRVNIDDIIIGTVLSRYDYPSALEYFLETPKTDDVIISIGMNRDGAKHDKEYANLYNILKDVYKNKDNTKIAQLHQTTRQLSGKMGSFWRKLLFGNKRNPKTYNDLVKNKFGETVNDLEFDKCFFNYLHLLKIKSTLSDYKDLNRRYFKITNAFLFNDGKITFSPIFESFFKGKAGQLFEEVYKKSQFLTKNVDIEQINKNLLFNKEEVIKTFNNKNNTKLTNIDDIYSYIEDDRYIRFRKLIDTKFKNKVLLSMLSKFEDRQHDKDLINAVGGEADVPTIFEYIVGIIWYKISGYKGKILDYMKLSLDMDLLPITHAGGGESDIVYKYPKTQDYPSHTLLIECTLMQGTIARHGEMEPVSRHLANYMIDEDKNSYCTFISNSIHSSVISDFRMRINSPWYRSDEEGVDGMKILPLQTSELQTLLEKNITYSQIYNLFMQACSSNIKVPPQWYKECIKKKIDSM